jgi:hypothetical protein
MEDFHPSPRISPGKRSGAEQIPRKKGEAGIDWATAASTQVWRYDILKTKDKTTSLFYYGMRLIAEDSMFDVVTPALGAENQLFAPALLLPTQMARSAADRWLLRLYRAILEDAVECLGGRGAPNTAGVHPNRERVRRRQAAWDWVMSDAEYCFSFRTVCLVLDLDVDAVRRQLARRSASGMAFLDRLSG